MSTDHRRRVAAEAARLMYTREESHCDRARMKAARRIAAGEDLRNDLPTSREIHAELEQILLREGPEIPRGTLGTRPILDRFHHYRVLLEPLERVKGDRVRHPEGDVLYHSLQVFELAREELPYDEEFLLAALLHDVGKAIDPKEHIAAALDALEGTITPRTAWLIEHHDEAIALREGTLGVRSQRRLAASESFEELKLLAACDLRGRIAGVSVSDLEDALTYLRQLAESCGE